MSTKSILKLSYLSFYDSTCLCLNYLFYGLLGCSFLAVVMINYLFFYNSCTQLFHREIMACF